MCASHSNNERRHHANPYGHANHHGHADRRCQTRGRRPQTLHQKAGSLQEQQEQAARDAERSQGRVDCVRAEAQGPSGEDAVSTQASDGRARRAPAQQLPIDSNQQTIDGENLSVSAREYAWMLDKSNAKTKFMLHGAMVVNAGGKLQVDWTQKFPAKDPALPESQGTFQSRIVIE